jgi:A/G-specific adenine glycosylase
VTANLLAWYDAHSRDLPWRESRTPYRVWISEVMLQQTQVASAAPYYLRWLGRFPDLATLAAAELDTVLKAWEGLGYYRRARQLHRAAREIRDRFGGALPSNPDDLASLPGVGPYTAAAIASIAFGVTVVAVDANVARVAARLYARNDLRHAEVAQRLAEHQPRGRAGDFNEALMELGALVCTSRAPQCCSCPVGSACGAHRLGRVADFPAAKIRRKRPLRRRYALVYSDDAGVALMQRDGAGLLAGLWGFVQSEVQPATATLLPSLRHSYSHFELELVPSLVDAPPTGTRPIPLAALERIAASTVDRKLLARLQAPGGPLRPPAVPSAGRSSAGGDPR